MLRKYVIYLSIKETCDTEFSLTYNSFNSAKDNIDNFLSQVFEKRNKKYKQISKEEQEKLKYCKNLEDLFYVRRKNSEAIIYFVSIIPGTFYNGYSIEKYGKIGIAEFIVDESTGEHNNNEIKIKDMHVTNYERGAHVSFVSELKNVLAKRERKPITFEKEFKKDETFVNSLVEGKSKLKSSKNYIHESND